MAAVLELPVRARSEPHVSPRTQAREPDEDSPGSQPTPAGSQTSPAKISPTSRTISRLNLMPRSMTGEFPRAGFKQLVSTVVNVTRIFSRSSSDVGADDTTPGGTKRNESDKKEPNEKSVKACQRFIEQLKDGKMTDEELESSLPLRKEYEDLIRYKNRLVNGTILHYAVSWTSEEARRGNRDAAGVLKRLLRCKADLRSKATYQRDKAHKNSLEAIHIAAGCRCATALGVLIEHAGTDKEYVKDYVNTYCLLGDDKFYTPLHDATYLGQIEAGQCHEGDVKASVSLLLKNSANPTLKNINGYTPLHWLAMTGLQQEGELEEVVRLLLNNKARLDVETNPGGQDGGKIPLQMAASEKSQFPRRLMHLLAPSIHCAEQAHRGAADAQNQGVAGTLVEDEDAGQAKASAVNSHSVFDDLCLLACHNTQAAEMLASKLTEDERLHNKIRRDAQIDNAVDRMAQLFHMAPKAAAKMLELLLVQPIVEDSGKNPIRTRAVLGSSTMMRCHYQPDMKPVNDKDGGIFRGLDVPTWRCDSAGGSDQACLAWHETLIVVPKERGDQIEDLEDVDTKALLLPNILDIDVFMALAGTRQMHINVFSFLSVQGIIYCLWDHLLYVPWILRVGLNAMEIGAMFFWGTSPTIDPVSCPEGMVMPKCWAVIAASFVRDAIILFWRLWNHWEKYCGHDRKYRRWQEQLKASQLPNGTDTQKVKEQQGSESKETDRGAERGNQQAGESKDAGTDPEKDQALKRPPSLERPPSLHALWRPKAFLSGALILELPLLLVKLIFLCSTMTHSGDMNKWEGLLLTGGTLLQCLQLIYMFRLTTWGKKVTTIMNAFFSDAMREMLVVVILSFVAVTLAGFMLQRDTEVYYTSELLNLYKGLLFGDGSSLDELGLKSEKSEKSDGSDTTPNVGSNGTARTALALGATVAFNICMLNLIIAIYGSEYDRLEEQAEVHFLRERAKTSCDFLLGIPRIPEQWKPLMLQGMVTAFVVGCGVLSVWANAPAVILAASLIGVAQVLLQSHRMATEWFPWRAREDENEGPGKPHFLWLCYGKAAKAAAKVSSDDTDGDSERDKQGSDIQGRLAELERQGETVCQRLSAVDTKLDAIMALLEPQKPA